MTVRRVCVGLYLGATLFANALFAQTAFYNDLLQRGKSGYEHGQYASAINDLRIASFGFLDDVPSYEIAQIYLALASSKSNHSSDARAAALKLIAAERITPSYRTLPLDATIRRDFDELLPKITTGDDLTIAPSMTTVAARGAKSWKEIIDLYSDIRTRRRLSTDETATLFAAEVEMGRIGDAAGMRTLMTPAVAAAPSIQAQLSKVPAPPASIAPAIATGAAAQADITPMLRDAAKAISEARFGAARSIYLKLAQQLPSKRDLNLEIARGLHRVSAYRESSAVYQKLYPLKSGEEAHMLAEAINRYELGDIDAARTLLSHALAASPAGPELSMYRPLIERAR